MSSQIDQTEPLDQNDSIEHVLSDDNRNVFSVQKYLLILLFVQWFICVVTLGVGIYSILIDHTANICNEIKSLMPIIALTLYYIFGLRVVYKKNRTGLLIFASIGLILFITASILLCYIILAIIVFGIGFDNTIETYEFLVFIGILFVIIIVVGVLSLKLSFDLVTSIKTLQYSTV